MAFALRRPAPVRAADIEDWSRQPKEFMPGTDPRKASMLTWGKGPRVGAVIGLKHPDGGMVCYRVTEYVPGTMSADYDGHMVRLEFVPGREIEDDR